MPDFIDSEVNNYIGDLGLSAIQLLIDDLVDDFDVAISNRFSVSTNQSNAIANTPAFFKSVFTSALMNREDFRLLLLDKPDNLITW